ncbi:hypothetical protein DFR24_3316 [Panacagrimonas perspica]|uniref:Phosphatidate cytidylyltransferase n=1 Tax=Panacagrimonas perspica TaxID=381431 RepID=A0A4R7P563_9GAMM|nr:hypothetical protein [Panacagrimonas perspica]TDU28935.1 hypothetical protein DFR24_3316 [Panacagrimonas perspica]THD02243.1 hypothetical protein B1810_15040 [Panacagrimonas perspica]
MALNDPLRDGIGEELRRPVHAAVTQLADQLAALAGSATAAVLFYGSGLRDETLDGVLDFYVLLDDVGAWPGSRLAALANRVLPPNVAYLERTVADRPVRAKVAVMSLAQFAAGMTGEGLDTTLWARFSQPCRCVHARSETDRAALASAVQDAVKTAARWAAALGPERGAAEDYWRALFARTYVAEIRVERSGRADDLVARDAARYAELLPLAWTAAGIAFNVSSEGELSPQRDHGDRRGAARRWAWRQRLGKPLNALRLLKAACTFDGAADYVAWKVERHSGVHLDLSDWQRRHPLLAAPGVYWRLRRAGILR